MTTTKPTGTEPTVVAPAIAAISAVAAVVAVLTDVGTPVSGPLVAWFLLVCPGLTVVGLIRIADPMLALAATVGISIAAGVVVAQTLLFAGLWSPVLALVVLAALTVSGSAVSVALAWPSRPWFAKYRI